MKKAVVPPLPEGYTKYSGILLDSVDNFYTYKPSIPVYSLGGGLNAIGQAELKKSKRQLYCDLLISKESAFSSLYPHTVFDCKGKVYAVMLLASPNPDHAVRPIAAQSRGTKQ